jgi:hypothetical protein
MRLPEEMDQLRLITLIRGVVARDQLGVEIDENGRATIFNYLPEQQSKLSRKANPLGHESLGPGSTQILEDPAGAREEMQFQSTPCCQTWHDKVHRSLLIKEFETSFACL